MFSLSILWYFFTVFFCVDSRLDVIEPGNFIFMITFALFSINCCVDITLYSELVVDNCSTEKRTALTQVNLWLWLLLSDEDFWLFNTMASNAPSAPTDLPPAYSDVVGSPHYGFVAPEGSFQDPNAAYQPPKGFTAPGVYPHPPGGATVVQPVAGPAVGPGPAPVPLGIVMPQAVGSEPTTITCFNCGKVVTTRVTYTTAWHTHLVAGSVCVITM